MGLFLHTTCIVEAGQLVCFWYADNKKATVREERPPC